KEGGAAAGGGMKRPPTPVEVADVTVSDLVDQFHAVGTVRAVESITVVSEIGGVLRALPFREGDHVARGTLLARIDDAELKAALDRSEAVREQSQNAYDRVKRVVEQNAGSAQDLDDAAAALKVAEAEVDLAAARLEKTRITAAFSGVVGARSLSVGAYVQPGTPITDLTRLDEIEVRFSASERYAPRLERGAIVSVSTTAFPGVSLSGQIHVVDPVLDPDTRSATVIARVANPQEQFRPGMSADVTVDLTTYPNSVTVPSEAIFAEGNSNLVYVVGADSTVARVPVEVGMRLPAAVQIVSGLEPGMKVVRAGHQKLYPGAKVMPVNSGDDAAQASHS
ncbi:MAG: efflux RND transporter periplasmic adaptor subunit, partial [Planctomycetes bacterium]|nr:efflux RND transporter periplasmic adaptor subunit [Planctomycetota bacterium]